MTVRDLQPLFAYTEWANDRIFAAAEQLPDAQWAQPVGGSFGCVRDTLAHMVVAEWLWHQRCRGLTPTVRPAWLNAPAPATLRAELARIQDDRRAFLAGLSDADVERPLTFTLLSGQSATQPLGSVLLHVVNHATYHRGQVAAMLRQLGLQPPATDLFVFNAAQGT